MAGQSVKIAVTIPKAVYGLMEDVRRKLGLSRSAFIDQAVEKWLESQKLRSEIRRYEEGYRRMPEDLPKLGAWEGAQAFSPNEDWS